MRRPLKRTTHIAGIKAESIAKRLRYVERQAYRNRPEMKMISTQQSGAIGTGLMNVKSLLPISQGSTALTREGNKIRVWRVEVRGVADPLQDVYLIQSHNGTEPVIADFTSGQGGFIDIPESNTLFTEWSHRQMVPHQTTNANFKIIKKFTGMNVSFQGSTNIPVTNGLYLVIINKTTGSLNHDYNARVWYTE